MLRIVEPPSLRHHVQGKPVPRRSWIASILFHGLLAVLLWSVVFRTIRYSSITLSATPSNASQSISLETGDPRLEVDEPWGTNPKAGTEETKVDVESEFHGLFENFTPSLEINRQFSPNSIEFFGTRAYGKRFVFVLDISFSMKARDGERYRRACEELIHSVSQLRQDQEYFVFLFSWYTHKMFYQPQLEYVPAQGDHVERLSTWLRRMTLGAGTDPRKALSLSLRMDPDALFLLSDGHFNEPASPNSETGWFDQDDERSMEDVIPGIEKRFRELPIHTISLENPFTVESMRKIAKSTGGQFRYVRTQSRKPVDFDRFLESLKCIHVQHKNEPNSKAEFETRLSFTRELISSGELVFAEYILRPVVQADESLIHNRVLLNKIVGILNTELAGARLEDFDLPRNVMARISDP